MASKSNYVEEKIKNPNYNREYDKYIKFINNFAQMLVEKYDLNATRQYYAAKERIIKKMKTKYHEEYIKRNEVVDTEFLIDLLDAMEINMDEILKAKVQKPITDKSSHDTSLNSINVFSGKAKINEDMEALLNKIKLAIPSYDLSRLEVLFNTLRSANGFQYHLICRSFLNKTNNRFIAQLPYTSNYLANNPENARIYLKEYNVYLAFVNDAVVRFVKRYKSKSEERFMEAMDDILNKLTNDYLKDMKKRWKAEGKDIDEMFAAELIAELKAIYDEKLKAYYYTYLNALEGSHIEYQFQLHKSYGKSRRQRPITRMNKQVRRSKNV